MLAPFTPTREMVDAVVEWRERQIRDRAIRPIVPHLRARFGLDNAQAIAVINAANKGGADASQ